MKLECLNLIHVVHIVSLSDPLNYLTNHGCPQALQASTKTVCQVAL
jgi:hypothetical protein